MVSASDILIRFLKELRVQDYMQNRKSPTTTSAFGQTAFGGAQPAANTGLFGAQTTQQPSTSVFGAPAATNTTNTAFGAFGQPAQQPANTGTGLFGGGTSAFGQPQQQQQPSAFGTTTTSAFGQPQQQNQQTGLFGNTGTSAFGSTANKPAFGTFGTGKLILISRVLAELIPSL